MFHVKRQRSKGRIENCLCAAQLHKPNNGPLLHQTPFGLHGLQIKPHLSGKSPSEGEKLDGEEWNTINGTWLREMIHSFCIPKWEERHPTMTIYYLSSLQTSNGVRSLGHSESGNLRPDLTIPCACRVHPSILQTVLAAWPPSVELHRKTERSRGLPQRG